MTTKNVLEYVQQALSVMDSDKVDTINDTEEAMQLAHLLQDVYDELLTRQDWEFLYGPVSITAAADVASPTKFTIPTTVRYLKHIWYNVSTDGGTERRKLEWVEPEDFLDRYASGAEGDTKELVTAGSQIVFYVFNDRMPKFYTSFDNETIYCDAYDSDVESTLQTSKVSAMGIRNPTFEIDDDFVPDLPEHLVPLLQHTLNAAASVTFKQQANPVDENRALRQLAYARRRESRNTREHYYKNQFGRR